MTPATPKINAYDELLAIEASALNKLRISHYEAQEELLRVPDAGDTNCAAFDHAVREACECAIPDAWLPLGGGETTRDVRVPAGHFALVHHLRRDLPWLGRPCPHTGVPADYGLVLTGAWTAIANGLRGGKLRGAELTQLHESVLVSLDETPDGRVTVQLDVQVDVVDVSATIRVPQRVQYAAVAIVVPRTYAPAVRRALVREIVAGGIVQSAVLAGLGTPGAAPARCSRCNDLVDPVQAHVSYVQVDDEGGERTVRLHSACGDALKSSRRLPHGARLRRHAAAAPAPHVCAVNDVVPGHVYDGELVFRVGKLRFWLRARVAASAAEVAAGGAAPWASGVWSPRDGLCVSRFTALCLARQLHPVQPNANAAREELAVIQALLWGYAPVIPGFAPEGCAAGGNRRAVGARLERGLTLEDIEAYIERRKQIATDAALMGHGGVEFSDVAAGGARAGATCPKPATPIAADGAAFARRDAVRILVKLAPDAVQGLDMLVSGDMYTRDFVIDMGGTTAAAPVGAQSNDGAAKAYECLWQASLNSSSTESLRSAYVSGLAAAKALAANIDAALQVTSAEIGDPGALIAAANEAVATMLGTPRSALAGAGNTAAEIRQLLEMNIGIDAAMTEAESAAAWQSQPALLWQVQALADFAEAFKAIETALEHGKASLTRRVETVLMSRTTLAARSALLKSVQHARGRAKENLREAIDAADARNATTSPGEKAAKAAGEGFGPGAPRAATAAAAATHPRAVSDTEGAADATEHPTDPDLLPSTSWRVPVIDAAPSPGLSDSAASDGTPPAPATPAATPAAARAAPPRWADPKLQRAIQREVRRALHPRACEEAPLWPRRLAFAFGGAYNVFVRFRLPRATLDGLRENVWDAKALTAAREAAGAAPASFWTPDPEFIFELTLARGFATAPSVLCHTEVGAFVVGEEICMGAYSSYHVDNAYTFDLPRQVGALVQLAAGVLSGDDELAGSVGVVWEYDAHAFALLASASAGSNAAFSERRGLHWAEARGG